MYETNGNNAYQLDYSGIRKPSNARVDIAINRVRAREEKMIQRRFSQQRLAHCAMYIVAVAMIALAFTGILYRNAQILEMNYQNVRIQREITQIKTDAENIKEEFVNTVDLAAIRKIAIDELGMRAPATTQMVSVHVPAGDRVVLESSVAGEKGEILNLDNMFDNLEGFFKTMR